MVNFFNAPFIINQDPSRTTTLRAQYVAAFSRRFAKIKQAIKGAVVENDVFGLKENPSISFLVELPPPRNYAFKTDSQKVEAFIQWLEQLVDENLIERIVVNDPLFSSASTPWTTEYILTAYKRGLLKVNGAYSAMEGFTTDGLFYSGLQAPVNRDLIQTLFTRNFEDLKGISSSMSQSISRILAEGLMNGYGADKIARDLLDGVDGINRVRARLLARTEIVHTYNRGFLKETERLSQFFGEDESLVIWKTVGDLRVRERHRNRHNLIMTVEQAAQRIGEPNCRCSFANYIPQVDGPVPEDRRFGGN